MAKLIDVFPNWETSGIFAEIAILFGDLSEWLDTNESELDIEYYGNHSGNKVTSPLIDKYLQANANNENPNILTSSQIEKLAKIVYMKYGKQWNKLYNVFALQYNPIENYSMTETETPDLTRTETPNITETETPNITRTETPDITETETPDISTSRNKAVKTDLTVENTGESAGDIYGFNSVSPVPATATNANGTQHTTADPENNTETESTTETGTRQRTQTGTREETETGTRQHTEAGTRTTTETGTRELTRAGNIGVTTSQQMIKSEVDLWQWDFYNIIFNDVDNILTCPIYEEPILL